MTEKTLPSSGGYFTKEMLEILEAGEEKEPKKPTENSSEKEPVEEN